MAIVIDGKTKCPICGKVIEGGQPIVGFTHFVPNELDPLFFFSDAAYHADCFWSHPLAAKVQARWIEMKRHVGPGKNFCVVCKKEITDPDDYFTLGHLSENDGDPLFRFNYVQAHRSCLPKWKDLRLVASLVERLSCSAAWGGTALDSILAELRRVLAIGAD